MERALAKAKSTMNEPRPPKPFTPNFQKIWDSHAKTKLPPFPTALPPDKQQQLKAVQKKRGVVSKFAREQVNETDISRLGPKQWLNDECINFYGALILGRSEASKENAPAVNGNASKSKIPSQPLNCWYFSTFFWPKLFKDGYEAARLAKWTKKFDIFEKDIVLIPINHGNTHWTSAAINFRKKRIESYDSMAVYHKMVFKHLRGYLDSEHRNKKKKPFDFTGWEDYSPDDVPQQENGYDCGVFTCCFLEAISRGEDAFRFTQQHMPYLRQRLTVEIGTAQLLEPQ
ncbi:cysteine proteinase [Pterulicium gracile]|uniref:Cysteine proteinase n=1 Tax=Pterulicium gracile TaxID=1884261 RepID=A0A5C3QX11_9AGAR|nr:cysteine proteinase [Pterula gracilis]